MGEALREIRFRRSKGPFLRIARANFLNAGYSVQNRAAARQRRNGGRLRGSRARYTQACRKNIPRRKAKQLPVMVDGAPVVDWSPKLSAAEEARRRYAPSTGGVRRARLLQTLQRRSDLLCNVYAPAAGFLLYDAFVFQLFQDAVGRANANAQPFGQQGCVHFRICLEKG